MRTLIIYFSLLLGLSVTVIAQTEVAAFDHYYNVNNKKVRSINTLHLPEQNRYLILFKDDLRYTAYLVDADFNDIGEGLLTKSSFTMYPNIEGITAVGDRVTLFLSQKDHKKWKTVQFDFGKRALVESPKPIKFKKQVYLKSFQIKNDLYVLKMQRESSIFVLQKGLLDGSFEEIVFDLSFYDFKEGKRSDYTLSRKLTFANSIANTNVISGNQPLSIEAANSRLKLYPERQRLRLTMDLDRERTYMVDLDILEKTVAVTPLLMPQFSKKTGLLKTNSYINDDYLYQLAISLDEMVIRVHDISNNSIVKEIRTSKNEEIDFKSTPLIQEGGQFKDYRELDNTKQFYRKMINSLPAIAVFKDGEQNILTVGASETFQSSGTGALFGVSGAILQNGLSLMLNVYTMYSRTKTMRFQSVFNNDFQFVPNARVSENVFDRIAQLEESLSLTLDKRQQATTTLTRLKDGYLWGWYMPKDDIVTYYLIH